MDLININKKKFFSGKVIDFSQEEKNFEAKKIVAQHGSWKFNNSSSGNNFVIIDYGQEIVINFFAIFPPFNTSNTSSPFPEKITIEISNDNKIWKVLHGEKKIELIGDKYFLRLPLFSFRYLKLNVFSNEKSDVCEIKSLQVGIEGFNKIDFSSKKLLSEKDFFWKSEEKNTTSTEFFSLDLERVFPVNHLILNGGSNGLPENFYIEASPDNSIWTSIIEEKDFYSTSNCQYSWDISLIPVRFLRFTAKTKILPTKKYGIEIKDLNLFAAPINFSHTHNIGELTPYSSIFQAGMVKLAKDGEDLAGTAVQASDRRLRDATTIFKGIVQFAEYGEIGETLAVQASDPRLSDATELKSGIVRLAYNRETKEGVVVQANDSRLQEASFDRFGIIKLCPDGQYAERSAVQGNDSRLQKATFDNYGICMLAKDGENVTGKVVQSSDSRLSVASIFSKGIVELAEDGEDKDGVVVQGNDRRLKDATVSSKGIVELAEDGEDKDGVVVQGNDRRLKDATVSSKGIVELAEDGEDKKGAVVQSNDSRLKDATVSSKGIVELAEDGEDKDGVVVQGNDKRLKDATTLARGIVELAEDGEDKDGVVVQGNDRRLKDATVSSRGIVELAEDGEDKDGVVVQGNDRRLKDATVSFPGIVKLAKDGENKAGVVVQGNDKRLKDATTLARGIVELAEDGEDKDGVVVQGNDKRLKDATTLTRGIVELAEDGEDKKNVVVQGNDKRLKDATTLAKGIVKLAKDGEEREGVAVQGNDKRLSNPREPLPHVHDYAPFLHDFNSHMGTLSITNSKNEVIAGIVPPSDNSAILFGKNESDKDGAVGVLGISHSLTENQFVGYGILGHANHIGVRGQSLGGETGSGSGVLGISRFGAGGVFSSEHNFSVIADGFGKLSETDNSINLIGNGDALYVKGHSVFEGKLDIKNQDIKDSPSNLVEMFEVDEDEFLSNGDLLVISPKGNSVLSRARTMYNSSVLGVISGNPGIIFDNTGKEKKIYPVALTGKVFCKIDARDNPVAPGDLIVTSNTPGCGMVGKIDSFDKMGTVIGKALDKLEEGIDLLPIFIFHQ